MKSTDLENRITRLEKLFNSKNNQMNESKEAREMTRLDSRIRKLENMILEDDAVKSKEDVLLGLLNALAGDRSISPNGNKLEKNYVIKNEGSSAVAYVYDLAIGDWSTRGLSKYYNIITDDDVKNPDYVVKDRDVVPVKGVQHLYVYPRERPRPGDYVADYYQLDNNVSVARLAREYLENSGYTVEISMKHPNPDDPRDLRFWTDGAPVLIFTLKKETKSRGRRRYGDSDSDCETLDDQERRHNSYYHGWH